ncbi:cell division protein SepF [Aminipila terrae]|uniref:Cell division protein SepF n=2 Tax=Aminipila terrae TaxID=2697030 RepID=A0A6P1MSM0_9FIRM|nr:cell division protein SepF [Aminipila terrae]
MQSKPMTANTVPFKMVVIEPKGFDECPKLVDNLKAKKPIIINLEKIESDTARKIFDFLSGATYAVNGNVQKIANNIFVFAPENVDISANVDHKGIDFSGNVKSPWR